MYILFDIGGTNMRLAVSKDGKRLGKSQIVPTPQKFDEGMKKFKEIALILSEGRRLKGIAGGFAGPIDRKKTKPVNAPNIPDWINKPLRARLEKDFGCPAYIENDAAIVGLGEAVYGAGKGKKIVAYITVSTGLGGARIVDEKVDVSAFGFEPGHQIIDPDGKKCRACGTAGHLEGIVSGRALWRKFNQEPTSIKNKKIWDEQARYLAMGLNNITVLWSPDVIVIGGSVSNSVPLGALKKYLKKDLKIFPNIPEIKRAKLKNIGGLYGALHYLNHVK